MRASIKISALIGVAMCNLSRMQKNLLFAARDNSLIPYFSLFSFFTKIHNVCTITKKNVVGRLQKTKLLDKHRTVYINNWLSSPELTDEMKQQDTYAAEDSRK